MRPQILRIGLLLAALLVGAGCEVRQPGRLEVSVMTGIKHLAVGEKKQTNPLPQNRENIEAGRKNFAAYCVACHGLDGRKTGVPFADSMSPPVPSLAAASIQRYTDGQLHSVIVNGVAPSGMPASRNILNDEEIWQIVQYIRHLPPAGSLGEPCFYQGDCRRTSDKGSGKISLWP
jgi:mono/diheme cytochrome c family protein